MAVEFDTNQLVKNLQESGIERDNAEAIANIIRDIQGELATKTEIDTLRSELKQAKDDIGELARFTKVYSDRILGLIFGGIIGVPIGVLIFKYVL